MESKLRCSDCKRLTSNTTRGKSYHRRTYPDCKGIEPQKRGPKVQIEAETLKKTKRPQLVLPEERKTVRTPRVQKPVPARFKTARFLKSPPA